MAIDTEEVGEDEDVPVLLENNKTAMAVEDVVTSFGYRAKTKSTHSHYGIFHYVLFGIMPSDAAYGLIIFLGCLFALKNIREMSPTMEKTLRMFKNCGISTLV